MRRLFGFHGRLGRSGFAALSLAVLAVVATTVPLLILTTVARGDAAGDGLDGLGTLLLPVLAVAGWSLLALGAKRLHDIGLSALHLAWISLVPVAASVLPSLLQWPAALLPWVWLCVASGTEGPNRFGPDPSGLARE
jgi:uncharacterized membrane protein YhaH (DUF805 family)